MGEALRSHQEGDPLPHNTYTNLRRRPPIDGRGRFADLGAQQQGQRTADVVSSTHDTTYDTESAKTPEDTYHHPGTFRGESHVHDTQASQPGSVAGFEYRSVWNAMQRSKDSLTPEEFYTERFRPDAETYVAEGSHVRWDTRMPNYALEFDEEGVCTLRPKGYKRPLRDLTDPDGTVSEDWDPERKKGINYRRHKTETRAIVEFEEMLADRKADGSLKDGDTFVVVSPPPSEIMLDPTLTKEERFRKLAQLGYPGHSLTHVWRKEGNEIVFVGTAQSYLHPKDHATFVRVATDGEYDIEPDDISLLSHVYPVSHPEMQDEDVLQGLLRELYRNAPEERKIVPPEVDGDESLGLVDAEQVNEALEQTERMLLYSYWALRYMNRRDVKNKAQCAKMDATFQAWQKAYYLLLGGEELPPELAEEFKKFQNLSDEQIKEAAKNLMHGRGRIGASGGVSASRVVGGFNRMETKEVKTSCGTGSGWSEESIVAGMNGGFTSQEIVRKAGDPCLSTAEISAGHRLLKAMKISQDILPCPSECPGCHKHPRMNIREIQKTCILDCCSKDSGARGRITNPYHIILLIQKALS